MEVKTGDVYHAKDDSSSLLIIGIVTDYREGSDYFSACEVWVSGHSHRPTNISMDRTRGKTDPS